LPSKHGIASNGNIASNHAKAMLAA